MTRLAARLLAAVAAAGVAAAPAGAGAVEIDCPALLVHIKSRPSLIERRQLLEVAAGRCPRDAAIAYEYAFTLERLRSYGEALRQYRTATDLDPSHAKSHVGVGDTLMLLGDAAGAAAAYERGLALDPANPRARKALELARIKVRAERGEEITSAEFARVMTEAEARGGPAESAEGPLLRMQIRFQVGAATLDDGAAARLAVVGDALKSGRLAAARLEIAGHTDDLGDPAANQRLSQARAEAVRDHLVRRHGLDAGRLVVVAFGSGRPVAANATPEGRRLNRRVEFRLLR